MHRSPPAPRLSLPFLSLAALAPMLAPLLAPSAAEAAPVKMSVTIAPYNGPGTYLALYLTDAAGAFKGTVWVAGERARYYRHLSSWYAASGGQGADGVTGASVGAGRTLTITPEISAAMIDAGYVLHIDAAAENVGQSPDEVQVPLTSAGAGKPVSGNGFIANFQYGL